ncbi:hypothetical protein [Halorubrum glutamatedens]|uniref:hypothetical protein n=1 Tax=Halorubrum glutamatedens TaxID=2707018 RepID=UPI000EFD1DD4
MPIQVKDVQAQTTKTDQAVRDAADKHDLNPDQFQTFWNDRFGHYAPNYIHEWADRIAHNRAHVVADDKTQEALQRAGYTR